MGKLLPATIDKSSFKEKLKQLINLGYLNRNRWDNTARICVLENEKAYTNLLFCKKTEIDEFKTYNPQRNKTIITTIFQPISTEFLFATTLHYSQNLPLKNYEDEAFVSTSVLLNSKTTKTCLKGGATQELLDFIQLSRYDPVEEHHHVNNLSTIPKEQLDLYSKYFGQICPAPHFHFASKQNAELLSNPTHLAINLHALIRYVEDVLKDDSPALQKYHLGLPILEIKSHPEVYQTTTNISLFKIIKKYGGYTPKLQEDLSTLINFNKSEQAKKIADNMLNTKTSYLNGLEAFFVDLILLAGISGGTIPPPSPDKNSINLGKPHDPSNPGNGGKSGGKRTRDPKESNNSNSAETKNTNKPESNNNPKNTPSINPDTKGSININIKNALMLASKITNLGQNKSANHHAQTLQKNLFKDIIKELDKGDKQNEF